MVKDTRYCEEKCRIVSVQNRILVKSQEILLNLLFTNQIIKLKNKL